MRAKYEAVAVAVTNSKGLYISKSIIQTDRPEQALAIASALASVEQVEATPVVRDFDVFGKCYWTNKVTG